ncbi:MAG: DUF1553 domain-containing protein [Planctomycetota bacterium]
MGTLEDDFHGLFFQMRFQTTKLSNPLDWRALRSCCAILIATLIATSLHGLAADVPATAMVTFETDVVPILTRYGCNSGACHGSAAGRGGLRLSLYGGNHDADYDALVYDLEGRRVNLVDADESLLIRKPSEEISHGGGYLIEEESDAYSILTSWIAGGARRATTLRLTRLQLHPSRLVLKDLGDENRIVATAHYSDGSQRDVTPWLVLEAEDPEAVTVDQETASIRANRRGRHIVIARFVDQVVPLEMVIPFEGGPRLEKPSPGNPSSPLDAWVDQRLDEMGMQPTSAAPGAVWRRRVCLDLVGRLPFTMPSRTEQSLANTVNSDRSVTLDRAAYVDELLASREFVDYWTYRVAGWLRVGAHSIDAVATQAYHAWLRDQIERGAGFDRIARELITALGDTQRDGPANFYRSVEGPREQAELFGEFFMGTRLRCANCHDHPLDRWTQDDYHGLAAIFARVRMEQTVSLKERAEVIHPGTLRPAVMRIPGVSTSLAADESQDVRIPLADWLFESDNATYARAIVNRLWQAMMGRGLVEPVDDFRATNPATHPALLDWLAEDFVASGYDLRHTLRMIALSQTYGRSSVARTGTPSETDFYAVAPRRRLSAEVLADAISDVLGVADQYGRKRPTRAIELASPKVQSVTLDVLGRCDRKAACTDSGQQAMGLSQTLHLFNGPLLNERIVDSGGRLNQLRENGMKSLAILEHMQRLAIGRPMTRAMRGEHAGVLAALSEADVDKYLEDFVWALLCCDDFTSNW